MFFGYGETTLGDLKAEKRLCVPLTEDFLGRWNIFIPVKPKDFVDRLVAGTPYHPEVTVALDGHGNGLLKVKLRTGAGEMVAEFDRELELGRGAVIYESMLIHKAFAGKGLGRRLEANAIGLFERLSVTRIEIEAGGTIGAYAWARFGFVPNKSSWSYLTDHMRRRFEAIADKVTPETAAVVTAVLASDDPRGIWPLVDLRETVDGRPVGAALLKEMLHGWTGRLLLSDPLQRARFDAYVKTAPSFDQPPPKPDRPGRKP